MDEIVNSNYTVDDALYLPTRSTRRKIVVASLLFCWAIIGYITHYGNPDNSLHQSIASWAFFSWIAIVFSYAIGAGYENQKVLSLQETIARLKVQK